MKLLLTNDTHLLLTPYKYLDFAIGLGLTALCVYALMPSLSAIPIEGFAYFVEALSMFLGDGVLDDHIRSEGFNAAFFYHTRPAMVWLLAAAGQFGAGYVDLAPIAGVLMVAAALYCAGAFSASGLAAPALAVLSMPILMEISYFTNANLFACVCALTGVGLAWRRRGLGAAAIAGALLSMAFLFRFDQLLSAALGFAAILATSATWAEAVRRTVALGVGFVAVQGLLYAAELVLGLAVSHPLMRLQAAAHGVALWARDRDPLKDIGQLAFTMAPAAIPAVVGYAVIAVRLSATRGWIASPNPMGVTLFFFIFPALFYAATVGRYFDGRILTVFAPVVLLAVVEGVGVVTAALRDPAYAGGPRLRAGAAAAAVATGLALFAPTSFLAVVQENEAAPVSLTGRMWEQDVWRDWMTAHHRALAAPVAAVDAMLAQTEGPILIVSQAWNVDRAADYALARRGFRRTDAPGFDGACAPAERWSDGVREVAHLRLHLPFVRFSQRTASSYGLLAGGGACIAAFPPDRRWFLDGQRLRRIFREVEPLLPQDDGDAPAPISDALLAQLMTTAHTVDACQGRADCGAIAATEIEILRRRIEGAASVDDAR